MILSLVIIALLVFLFLFLRQRSRIKKLQVENGRLRSDLSQIKSRAKSLLCALDCKADTDISRIRIANYAIRLDTFIGGRRAK